MKTFAMFLLVLITCITCKAATTPTPTPAPLTYPTAVFQYISMLEQIGDSGTLTQFCLASSTVQKTTIEDWISGVISQTTQQKAIVDSSSDTLVNSYNTFLATQ